MDRCRHLWQEAPGPDDFAVRCRFCGAWVSVIVLVERDVFRYRFRCLGGTDPLVLDEDLRAVARLLLPSGEDRVVYAGPPRDAGQPQRRRRRAG